MTLAPKFVVHIGKQPDGFAETMNLFDPGWITTNSNQLRSGQLPTMTAAWGLTSASSVRTRSSSSKELLVDLLPGFRKRGDQMLGTGYYLIHRFVRRTPLNIPIFHSLRRQRRRPTLVR